MRRKTNHPLQCPCQSGQTYAECCQPYHGDQTIPNPLSLMRARFAAFNMILPQFIIDTTAPDNPGYQLNQKSWCRDLRRYCARTNFTGLQILAVQMGQSPLEGFVTFQATLDQNGQDCSFTERSRFIKLEGVWLYHSGDMN